MSHPHRIVAARLAVAAAIVAFTAGLVALTAGATPTSAATPSLGQLQSTLGQEQSRQQSLSTSIGSLNRSISSLAAQITLVRHREAEVDQELTADRVRLTQVQASLIREQALLARLRRRLARAQAALARQLVSSYESASPDLVSVVLEAQGFQDLLNRLKFLGDAQRQQQSIISLTRAARAQADAAAARLGRLERTDRRITAATQVRARALAGMNELLGTKQAALDRARVAQQQELAASRTRAQALHRQISHVQAEQAAAAAAAAQHAVDSGPAPPSSGPLGPSGGSGGWVIPYPIVLCESGGQNDPPNSAGASGYYQIIPTTWQEYGGTGPAAYLTSKAEQDAVAARIWKGAGPGAWDCAAIVGIH